MATSGSKSVSVATGLTLKFSWSRSDYSIANNTSTVSWQMDLVSTGGNITSSASKSWSITVNGTSYSGTNTVGIDKNATKKLASGSTTIKHNADGSKSFNYSFSQQFSITYSGATIGTKSGSGTGTLNTLPRASTVSATNAYIGSATTITITRANSKFKHTLQYKLPGQTSFTNIVSKTTETSYSWVLNGSLLYPKIPEAKSMKITLNCITYDADGNNIGSNTCEITATCKSSLCAPYFFEPSIQDTNTKTTSLTGDSSVLVKYYSTAQIHSNPHAQNEATIVENIISSSTEAVLDQVATFTKVSSNSFDLYTKDSRGFEKRETITAPMVNYVKLTCVLEVSAPTADGKATMTVSGNCFGGNFGAIDNVLTLQIRLKMNDEEWTGWENLGSPTVENNKYTFSLPLTLDYRNKYGIQVQIGDLLATAKSKEVFVKSLPVFDWSADDFKFNVPVAFGNTMGFTRSDGNLDVVKAEDGKLFFMPNYPTNTTQYKMCITPGDVITIDDNTPLAGYVSNSKKTLLFTIPINKPLVGVSGFTISGAFEARGITGNLYNPTTNSSIFSATNAASEGLTVNCYLSGSCIRATITCSSGIKTGADVTTTITNNTPVTVVPYNPINITFN